MPSRDGEPFLSSEANQHAEDDADCAKRSFPSDEVADRR
jgi:hypothetical protein